MRKIVLALSLAAALPVHAHAQDLVGATFHVEAIAGARVAANTATFQPLPDGRVAGSGGCNRYSGAGSLEAGKARFGPLASTRMACAPNLMAQERAFFDAMGKAARYEARDDALDLLDASGEVLVRLRRR